MSIRLKTYRILIIAAVLLVVLAFAGAASAGSIPEVEVWDETASGLLSLDDGESAADGQGGTATLQGNPASDDLCTLVLHNFNVTESGLLIKATGVPHLTITLDGDSNLTGSFAGTAEHGLIYATGNLTITTTTGGKLSVSNTAGDSGPVFSIYTENDLTIEQGANVTAAAHNTYSAGGDVTPSAHAFHSAAGNVNILGSDTVVDAIAVSDLGNAYSVSADRTIRIDSATLVHAAADGYAYAHALGSSFGDISITGAGTVHAHAESSTDDAYAIISGKDIVIDSADLVDAVACGNQYAVAIYAYNDTITVKGADTRITAEAESRSGSASAIRANNSLRIDSAESVDAVADGYTTADALVSSFGDVSMAGAGTIHAYAAGLTNETFAIIAGEDVVIDSVDQVDVAACGNLCRTEAIYACNDIVIVNGTDTRITAEAESSAGSANAVWACGSLLIDSAKSVDAVADGHAYAVGLGSSFGDVSMTGSAAIHANASSSTDEAYAILSGKDIVIDSVDMVDAAACGYQYAVAIYAFNDTVTIKGADTRINAQSESIFGEADALWARDSIRIESAKSVHAAADGYLEAHALSSYTGDISIDGDTTVTDANATCRAGAAYPVQAGRNLTIGSVKKLTAIGVAPSNQASSFAYDSNGGSRDFSALETGYTFGNATTGASLSFEDFDQWHLQSLMMLNNQNAVIIEKNTPTTQATQASPAPFLGIIAGLGAAGLIYRLRR